MDNQSNIARFEAEMSVVKRPGIDKLMGYIRSSDFYTAPASTRYHLSCEGGLLQHSLNVLDALRGVLKWNAMENKWEYRVGYPQRMVDAIPDESVIIIALTHDLCKTYFYGVSERNAKVKNPATGREEWQKVPFYTVNDRMPIGGHGFKSAFLVKEYMTLTNQEFYAIRWHMGFSDAGEETNALKAAIAKYPIVWAVHTADMIASCFMEAENGNTEMFTPLDDDPAEAEEEIRDARAEAMTETARSEPEYPEAPPIEEAEA